MLVLRIKPEIVEFLIGYFFVVLHVIFFRELAMGISAMDFGMNKLGIENSFALPVKSILVIRVLRRPIIYEPDAVPILMPHQGIGVEFVVFGELSHLL